MKKGPLEKKEEISYSYVLVVGGKVTPLPNDKRVEKLVDDATERKKRINRASIVLLGKRGEMVGFHWIKNRDVQNVRVLLYI